MKITLINKENEDAFMSFMSNEIYKDNEELLRIGALDDDDNVAGALAAQISTVGADILSLYVNPEYRRKGYGREMVNTVFSLVSGTESNRVSAHFPKDDTAMAFFDAMGFELIEDMAIKYARLGEILESPVCRKNVLSANSDNVRIISELNAEEKNHFANYMKKRGFWVSGYYDPEYSSVCLDGDRITSTMLAHAGDGVAAILWMDFDRSYQKQLFKHMGVLIRRLESDERFDRSSKVFFAAQNEKFVDILSKLTLDPGIIKKEDSYIFGAKVIVDEISGHSAG